MAAADERVPLPLGLAEETVRRTDASNLPELLSGMTEDQLERLRQRVVDLAENDLEEPFVNEFNIKTRLYKARLMEMMMENPDDFEGFYLAEE